jgi:hydroxymethylpyrimidine/phosphomethylpyrimidine kinase
VGPIVLTIAGSDPSGGAGLQADLKTFAAWRVYGTAVVSALTVQNTRGVHARHPLSPALVRAQLDTLLADVAVAAVKTGMLPDAATIDAVAAGLRRVPAVPLVVDPVFASTSGQVLADASAVGALRDTLLPLAYVVTPNLDEAAALVGVPVHTRADMQAAARALVGMGAHAALVKGGHLEGSAYDVLYADDRLCEFDAPRVATAPVHGTGCALSAALAAALARGEPLAAAVAHAKRYVLGALERAEAIGHGLRSLAHHVDPDHAG